MSNHRADVTRLRRLEIKHLLDTEEDPAFDRLTRVTAGALSVPVALLTFVDGKRQWFKSAHGLAEPWSTLRQTPLSHSFCKYVVTYGRPIIVVDARRDPLVQENLAIPELGVIAYLGVPIHDVDGLVLGSLAAIDRVPREWTQRDVALMTDVAALASAEIDLHGHSRVRAQMEAVWERAQRMDALGRLAGGVAHDFNNLLTVIRGAVDFALDDTPHADTRRQELETIRSASERAADLTRQLLAFSKRQVLRLQPVDLGGVVASADRMLRRVLREDITLEVRSADQPLPVLGDEGQLHQVVINLAVNARDAMPHGGRLRIETARMRVDEAQELANSIMDAGEYIALEVSDTGSGMDPETRSRVFEPFFTTKTGGTGLGLATVFGTVTQLGGHLAIDSAPGQGTTVRTYFPLCRPTREAGAPEAEAPPSGAETILVIDDDDALRATVARGLRRLGYEVLVAATAAQAADVWARHRSAIALILADVVMPDERGPSLVRRLLADGDRVPAIFMSGYTDEELSGQVVESPRTYLQKPFSPDQLARTVRSVLDARDLG